MKSIKHYLWAIKDQLRYSKTLRLILGRLLLRKGEISKNPQDKLRALMRAVGLLMDAQTTRYVRDLLQFEGLQEDVALWREVALSLPAYQKLPQEPSLTRSLLVKEPKVNGERGVLFMYFEYNYVRLMLGLSSQQLEHFQQNYDIVLSTSWSPTDYVVLGYLAASFKGRIYVQACNRKEIENIEAFNSKFRCFDSIPCDWLNPDAFPMQKTREYDFISVANWGNFKRHRDLFQGLQGIKQPLKIALIGQKEGGRTAATVKAEQAEYALKHQVDYFESIPIEQVLKLLGNTKAAIIMSRREGCCVAAVESLFAGCVLGIREDAHVGPLAYINEQTGVRLRANHLSEDLQRLLDLVDQAQPREWAMANVDHVNTWQRVNAVMKQDALDAGRPWTEDLVLPEWRPYPRYSAKSVNRVTQQAIERLKALQPELFADLPMS